jgi:branched-subunit amino acid transport protein
MILAGIFGLAAVTFVLKGLVPATRPVPVRYRHRLAGLAPALLAAFVVSELLDGDGIPALDAKAAGVAVATVLAALRAPLLVSVVAAAVTAAALRAVT